MSEELKCPVCGSMNYAIEHSDTTLVNTVPVVKNGRMINDDINIQTAHCACLECDAKFDICTRNGVSWIKQIYPYVTDSANHELKSNIIKSAAASEYDLPRKSNIVNGAFADEGNTSIGYVKSASPYVCRPCDPTTVTKPRITLKTLQYFLKGQFMIVIGHDSWQYYNPVDYLEYVPKEWLDREIEIFPYDDEMVKVVLI